MVTRSYSFQIPANNSIGNSDAIVCGSVLIRGLVCRDCLDCIKHNTSLIFRHSYSTQSTHGCLHPPRDSYHDMSTVASGAGTTGSFAFLVNSIPPVDMMPPSYPFPSCTDGQKVSVVINTIKTDVAYIFMVSAGNQYGISDCVEASWLGSGEGVEMCM